MRYAIVLAAVLVVAPACPAAEPRTVQEAYVYARDLLRGRPKTVAYDTRLLWIPRVEAAERRRWWQLLSGWIHAQSRESGIYPPGVVVDTDRGPTEVDPATLREWDRAVFVVVRLSLYRFSPKVWELFGHQHPFAHRVQHWTGGYEPTIAAAPWMADTAEQLAAVLELQKLTGSAVAVLKADNWFWQTAIVKGRKVGYHGLLEIRNQRDYERVIGYDPKANVDRAFLDELLAAVNGEYSGVTDFSRRVERREKVKGGYWLTKDNDAADAARDDRRNPLLQPDDSLLFRAIEAFGHNACGFWVTGLFDDRGNSQDSAPDFIGYNKGAQRNDGRIHNGYVCFACHDDGGLKDVRCHFREQMEGAQGLFPQTTVAGKVFQLLKYLPPLDPYLRADRERYAAALMRATGLRPAQFAAMLQEKFLEYEGGVDLARAAEDLGTTPETVADRFDRFLRATGYQDPILANLPKGKRILTVDWHTRYNTAALQMRGLVEWPKKR